MLTRRSLLAGALGAIQKPVLIDTHIHLFDPTRFPYHANAVYKPEPQPLEQYLPVARELKLAHVIIVHPEPYQDDHRYLEYCFAHEPSRMFFKGTCLFDPIAQDTPARMKALVGKNPGRIVALRIHATQDPSKPPTASGPIRDRDLTAPAMLATWRKAHDLGLAIQLNFIPAYASRIYRLASGLREMPIVLDHLGRYGEGDEAQYKEVLRLAELPRVYMKYSGIEYSSKQPYPHRDVKPVVRRLFNAFGADRMIWGGLGMNMADYTKQSAMFDEMFDFASEADKAKIRGLTAARLFYRAP
jgi:predicted TIM-barrel fold metal-dependent hydrolase